MRSRWPAPAAIVAAFAVGLAVYGRLPERVPSHWNIHGQVDGHSSRLFALLFVPLLATALWALLSVLPRIDPRATGYTAFRGTYALMVNLLLLFMAGVHVLILGAALGWPLSTPRIVTSAIALMLAAMGNELGRVQPNYFVGIRTPWTLADPDVWRRTHRLGGRVLVATGLLAALLMWLIPLEVGMIVFMALIIVPLLGLAAYSYIIWRQAHGGSTPAAGGQHGPAGD